MGRSKSLRVAGMRTPIVLAIVTCLMSVGIGAAFAGAQPQTSYASWSTNDYAGSCGDSSGGYVLAIQEAAYSRGSYGGPLDDLVGPNTVNGIRGLQTYLGLSVDGCAGPITWGAVRNLLQYIGPPPGYVADGPLYGINFGARSQYYSYNGCWASFAYRGTSSPVTSLRYYEFAGGLVGLTPLPPLTHGGTLPYCGTV
jgi:peptidoglycan hydrolase-like protein with peptidoglycan-binding domain